MPDRIVRQRRSVRADPAPPASFFRQMVDALPHMAWTARPDGMVEFLNKRVLEYTGRAHKELEGWGWRSMVHPDDWDRCLERWTKAYKTGSPYELEYRLRRHDGRYSWHLAAAMPVREDGRIVRWVGTSTDIENQKRAERLLGKARESLESVVALRASAEAQNRAQQERLRQLMDAMPAIAWIKDSKLRIDWASGSFVRILGKPLEEIIGRDDFAIWPKEMAERFRENDLRVLRLNGPVRNTASTQLSDGSIVQWLTVKFPFPDATGAAGVAGIGFDVTAEIAAAGEAAPDVRSPVERLSGRERQVLQMIVDGMTSAEVGERLSLSPKSVDTYRSRLMAKLGIEDLPTLVKFAIRHGLTTRR